MDALATAFGRDFRYPRLSLEDSSEFYGMPVAEFVPGRSYLTPDLAPFVLSDSVIIDGDFYERLVTSPSRRYTAISTFYQKAHAAGRLRLVDFDAVLAAANQRLNQMLQIDVEDIEPWLPRIVESLEIWDDILSKSPELKIDLLGDESSYCYRGGHGYRPRVGHEMHFHAVHDSTAFIPELEDLRDVDLYKALLYKSHRRTRAQREALEAFVASRLAYVNANIVLAQHFQVALYDWNDFSPFYQRKFGQVGQPSPDATEEKSQLLFLFSLLFPCQNVKEYDRFFKVLEDKRVIELRQLCSEAARGSVQFDQAFAASVWKEQLGWSEKQRQFSRRISWWTLPAEFIPYVGSGLSFGGQQVAEGIYAKINPSPHPWLFLFSDIFESNH